MHVIGVLDMVERIAKDTPPVDNAASRFGNPAFRTFYDRVVEVRSFQTHDICVLRD